MVNVMDRIRKLLPNLDFLLVSTIICIALVYINRVVYFTYYKIPKMYIEFDLKSISSIGLFFNLFLFLLLLILLYYMIFKYNESKILKLIVLVLLAVVSIIILYLKAFSLAFSYAMIIPLILVTFFNIKKLNNILILPYVVTYIMLLVIGITWIDAKTATKYNILKKEADNNKYVIFGTFKDYYITTLISKTSTKNQYTFIPEYSLIPIDSENSTVKVEIVKLIEDKKHSHE